MRVSGKFVLVLREKISFSDLTWVSQDVCELVWLRRWAGPVLCLCVGMFVCVAVSSLIDCRSKQSELHSSGTIPQSLPDYPLCGFFFFHPEDWIIFHLLTHTPLKDYTARSVWFGNKVQTTCFLTDLGINKLWNSAEFPLLGSEVFLWWVDYRASDSAFVSN